MEEKQEAPITEEAAGTAEAAEATAGDVPALDAGAKPEEKQPKRKKGWPLGVRILVWLAIIALVIFLTLFIVAMIVPDERINSVGDLVNYLVTEFQAL